MMSKSIALCLILAAAVAAPFIGIAVVVFVAFVAVFVVLGYTGATLAEIHRRRLLLPYLQNFTEVFSGEGRQRLSALFMCHRVAFKIFERVSQSTLTYYTDHGVGYYLAKDVLGLHARVNVLLRNDEVEPYLTLRRVYNQLAVEREVESSELQELAIALLSVGAYEIFRPKAGKSESA